MRKLDEDYRVFREQGGWVPLSNRIEFLFRGPDRVRYLNGQVTANLKTAKVPSAIPACITTAKGKLCAAAVVTVASDYILVDADGDADNDGALEARLHKYIVADDVTCTSLTMSTRIHLTGIDPEKLPTETRSLLLPVNRYGVSGFDLLRKNPDDADEPEVDVAAIPPIAGELLEIIRIEHGVPRWGFELDENTFPSEAGLDRTHVDFHKGCYIGQEVISRLESVGQANRSLRGFVAEAPLAAGMRLFTADDPARDLGRLTSATHSFALDRPIALGYLRRGAPETGLLAASADSPAAPVPVTLHPLPFVP